MSKQILTENEIQNVEDLGGVIVDDMMDDEGLALDESSSSKDEVILETIRQWKKQLRNTRSK